MQACTESSYHSFRKERLSAAEAGAASQAQHPEGPCLVPAMVQTEPAALSASQPAATEHLAGTPQGEPHWVSIPPQVGSLSIVSAWNRLLIGQAGMCALCSSYVAACCAIGQDIQGLHMDAWVA